MKVVATFHSPSSVSHSLKCWLVPKSVIEYLVVAKLDRLEVHSLQSDGLKREFSLEVWGKIIALRAIPIEGADHCHLMILTDHPEPEIIILGYDSSSHDSPCLKTLKSLSLFERTARPAEFLNDIVMDPSGKLAVVSCYTGKLKIIQLKQGKYDSDFDASIKELTLLALSFISSNSGAHALAIIHLDDQQTPQLLSRDLNIDDLELSPEPSVILASTPLSQKYFSVDTEALPVLISIPEETGDDDSSKPTQGVVLIGGRKIMYYEVASQEWQKKQKGKQRRAEDRRKSTDKAEAKKAKEKERERSNKKRKPKANVEWPWAEVVAWCPIDQNSTKCLLGDSYGRLAMLSLNSLEEHGLLLMPLGETSPATTFTYLTSQVLYVGSHFGDSQLVRIHSSPTGSIDVPTLPLPPDVATVPVSSLISRKGKGKGTPDTNGEKGTVVAATGSYLSTIDVFKNIAPVMDAALLDIEGVGQQEIVTCSGGRNTGSLSVIRNGADFQEFAQIMGLQNTNSIWPIRTTYKSKFDTHLLVSTLAESYLLEIAEGNTISHVSFSSAGFVTDSRTLACGNVVRFINGSNGQASSYEDSSLVVQVTAKGAVLFDYNVSLQQYLPVATWSPDIVVAKGSLSGTQLEVVAASVNASQFVLALNGARLVLLGLSSDNKFEIRQSITVGDASTAREISAVTCLSIDPTKYFAKDVAVAYWGANYVEIFSLTNSEARLVSVCRSPPLQALPRSLLLHNFGSDLSAKGADYRPHLLAGLADGSLVSFSYVKKELMDKNVVSMGETPVYLFSCQVDQNQVVFACGTRASVFSWDRARLRHSPVILKDVTTACPMNTLAYPHCLVLGSPLGLSIGKVNELDKLHIRSVPLGLDTPRRIKYHPQLKAFGVLCSRTEPARVNEPLTTSSSLKLIDRASFATLTQFQFGSGYEATAIESLSASPSQSSAPCFCVGTVKFESVEQEPKEGQLIIFRGSHEKFSHDVQISSIASTEVKGCVYALANISNMIAAAVNTSVNLFKVEHNDETVTIQRIADWDHNYFVTSLVARGNNLILGDAISSVSVLTVVNDRIQTLAKDYGPLWPACIETLDDHSIIGADFDGNLFTFSLRPVQSRTILDRDGGFHLSDTVNKFIQGALHSVDDVNDLHLSAQQVFFTVSGRIGVIIDMDKRISLEVSSLQRNMSNFIEKPGSTSHTRFRAPKNSRGYSDAQASAFAFLDGDFLERFLQLQATDPVTREILTGRTEAERIKTPLHRLHRILEVLQGMH